MSTHTHATYTRFRVVIDHDPEPDFSWLEQDMYDPTSAEYEPGYRTEADRKAGRAIDPQWYRDPENHVALWMKLEGECASCGHWSILDSLGNIDLFADGDDWRTGTFVAPEFTGLGGYLRECARDMLAGHETGEKGVRS